MRGGGFFVFLAPGRSPSLFNLLTAPRVQQHFEHSPRAQGGAHNVSNGLGGGRVTCAGEPVCPGRVLVEPIGREGAPDGKARSPPVSHLPSVIPWRPRCCPSVPFCRTPAWRQH